ncbi:MAG: glycosyltransferase [bacterium]|nr:glycosyltransferase [bacterium]
MKENILLFIETGGPGGAERVVVELAAEYLRQGHAVHVATLRTGWLTETLSSKQISFSVLQGGKTPDFNLVRQLSRLMKEKKITFLHSHLLDANFYGAMAARFSRFCGLPVRHVGTEHGDVHHPDGKHLVGLKLKTICFLGSKLTAVSDYTRRAMISYGANPAKVTVVGNPITSPLLTDPESIRRLRVMKRQELGLTEDEWVWIHVANIRPVKDQETLIRGFAKALEEGRQSQRLLIVGDGPLRGGLEELARELNVSQAISFLGFRDDVHELLAAADGFILTSRSEALPMSILEAALAGLYVISSDVGGVGEVIRDGETGALFPVGDVDGLASRIRTISAQAEFFKQKGGLLNRCVSERFSPIFIGQEYLTLVGNTESRSLSQ